MVGTRAALMALRPAVICAAPIGRTHGRTNQRRKAQYATCQRRAVHTGSELPQRRTPWAGTILPFQSDSSNGSSRQERTFSGCLAGVEMGREPPVCFQDCTGPKRKLLEQMAKWENGRSQDRPFQTGNLNKFCLDRDDSGFVPPVIGNPPDTIRGERSAASA